MCNFYGNEKDWFHNNNTNKYLEGKSTRLSLDEVKGEAAQVRLEPLHPGQHKSNLLFAGTTVLTITNVGDSLSNSVHNHG